MRPVGHLVVSVVGSGIIFGIYKNFSACAIFFISNILMDIDHFFDYFYNNGIKFVWLKDLHDWCYDNQARKLLLIFHSFELIFILWLIILIFKLGMIWFWFAVGLTVHLISDQLTNPLLGPS